MTPSLQMQDRLAACRACGEYPACPTSQRLAESDARCPLDPPRWLPVGMIDSLAAGQFGDAVHVLAQPVAKAVDAIAGTNLENCSPCKKRREDWNL